MRECLSLTISNTSTLQAHYLDARALISSGLGLAAWSTDISFVLSSFRSLSRAIRADIAAGKHVVCDRYAFSGIAYSVAKVSAARELEHRQNQSF